MKVSSSTLVLQPGFYVRQPGFYVRLKKSQTESIAGLYGHALPAPANMLISYMANRKPGCSTRTQALVEKPPRERPSASRLSRCAEDPPFLPHQRLSGGPESWCRRGTPCPA